MKCVILGTTLKFFARAIHTCAKIGDEIYFEVLDEGLAVRTVNQSRSAFINFVFQKGYFLKFNNKDKKNKSSLVIDENEIDEDQNETEAASEELFKCKVCSKSCASVFKSISSLEKMVDRCLMHFGVSSDYLVFKMFCRYGLIKTFNLMVIESEKLQALFSTEHSINHLQLQSGVMCEVASNFHSGVEELEMRVDEEAMVIRNLQDEESLQNQRINTEVVMETGEFDDYKFQETTLSIFCFKEFKAFLSFCESLHQPIDIFTEEAGRPVVFLMKEDPTFQCYFVLSTLSQDLCPKNNNNNNNKNKNKEKKINKNNNVPNKRKSSPISSNKHFDDIISKNNNNNKHINDNINNNNTIINNKKTNNDDINNNNIEKKIININNKANHNNDNDNNSNNENNNNSENSLKTPPSKKFKPIVELSQPSSNENNKNNNNNSDKPVVLVEDSDYEDED